MKSTLVFLSLFYSVALFAQRINPSTLSSGGAQNFGQTHQIEWTLGELAIQPIQNSSILVTQGFHQPQFDPITSVPHLNFLTDLEIFPNPVEKLIQVKATFRAEAEGQLELFDVHGRTIWIRSFGGNQITESLNFEDLPSSVYYLRIVLNHSSYIPTITLHKI